MNLNSTGGDTGVTAKDRSTDFTSPVIDNRHFGCFVRSDIEATTPFSIAFRTEVDGLLTSVSGVNYIVTTLTRIPGTVTILTVLNLNSLELIFLSKISRKHVLTLIIRVSSKEIALCRSPTIEGTYEIETISNSRLLRLCGTPCYIEHSIVPACKRCGITSDLLISTLVPYVDTPFNACCTCCTTYKDQRVKFFRHLSNIQRVTLYLLNIHLRREAFLTCGPCHQEHCRISRLDLTRYQNDLAFLTLVFCRLLRLCTSCLESKTIEVNTIYRISQRQRTLFYIDGTIVVIVILVFIGCDHLVIDLIISLLHHYCTLIGCTTRECSKTKNTVRRNSEGHEVRRTSLTHRLQTKRVLGVSVSFCSERSIVRIYGHFTLCIRTLHREGATCNCKDGVVERFSSCICSRCSRKDDLSPLSNRLILVRSDVDTTIIPILTALIIRTEVDRLLTCVSGVNYIVTTLTRIPRIITVCTILYFNYLERIVSSKRSRDHVLTLIIRVSSKQIALFRSPTGHRTYEIETVCKSRLIRIRLYVEITFEPTFAAFTGYVKQNRLLACVLVSNYEVITIRHPVSDLTLVVYIYGFNLLIFSQRNRQRIYIRGCRLSELQVFAQVCNGPTFLTNQVEACCQLFARYGI